MPVVMVMVMAGSWPVIVASLVGVASLMAVLVAGLVLVLAVRH